MFTARLCSPARLSLLPSRPRLTTSLQLAREASCLPITGERLRADSMCGCLTPVLQRCDLGKQHHARQQRSKRQRRLRVRFARLRRSQWHGHRSFTILDQLCFQRRCSGERFHFVLVIESPGLAVGVVQSMDARGTLQFTSNSGSPFQNCVVISCASATAGGSVYFADGQTIATSALSPTFTSNTALSDAVMRLC